MAQNKGEQTRVVVETASLSILLTLLLAFGWAWPIMLLFGALHAQWAAVPAFGYWTSYLITIGLLFVTKR